MGWQIAIAAVGAAVGAFNAYDEFHANRRIREDLSKIKRYLADIRNKINVLEMQNREILARLDRLPEQIYRIVEDIQDRALLRERYSVVTDLRDNFLVMRGGRAYRIRSDAWEKYRNAMTYLYEHEHRPSHIFKLIEVGEIALVVTKDRALPMVRHRVVVKRDSLIALRDDVAVELEKLLAMLKIKLDDQRYVQSHNLDENLPSLDQLEIVKMPNRTRTEHYQEKVCRRVFVGGVHVDRYERRCHHERRSRQVADTAFHKARDAHIADAKAMLPGAVALVERIKELNALINVLQSYADLIGAQASIAPESFNIFAAEGNAVVSLDQVKMDVLPMFVETLDKSSLQGEPPVAATDDFDEFDDYIDGCHGECEAIDPLRIEDDNLAFEAIDPHDRC